jgi:phosphoribosylformylglycinamidine cyclo-ligase|uniref:Phosphoribosylformylglycinamidine cyclo-ligase n=1 Tax=Desulfobacca acetoxidans TaxID=60893 RepID=A0A7C5ESW6_9BACT
MNNPTTYKDAGVDIDKAENFIASIRPLVRATFRTGVLGDIGAFAGLFHLDVQKYQDPVLVSATDGVGTKIKVAILLNRHDTIGIDLVAMCVNDILTLGATPLFFLDYLAMGELNPEVAVKIIEGITTGCRQARCSLIGGETAEMPGIYQPGDYDLAGFVVGVAERDHLLDGSDIAVGHRLIGIASSGLHANGYSLVRRVFFEQCGYSVWQEFPTLDVPLGEELLKPTRIYVETVHNLMRDFTPTGICHITGGGLPGNLPRILPRTCKAQIKLNSWPVPAIFRLLQEKGNIPPEEMLRTFNNGIGLVLVVPPEQEAEILFRLQGLKETAYAIGSIVPRGSGEPPVEFV